ncbi:MAG: hydrogenase iron-sulfur subunit [Anaerolineae bacterium]|nr:hydrogenase iron-sulfur subunit [Anaerolineae bacterium]
MTEKINYNQINPAWGDRHPVIVGFLCNWCSYRAADLAGTSRMGYPTTLRDIRIMCTGRLDPTFVIKALREGADGVLVMGCHPKQCHYESGNFKAMRRMALLRRTLAQLGVHPDRVQLGWASAAQGNVFAQTVDEMSHRIAELGPLLWSDTVEDLAPRTPALPELEEVVNA